MKNFQLILCAICAFSFSFLIACSQESDTISADDALLRALIDDPMLAEISALHDKRTNMIMYKEVELEQVREILEQLSEPDACDLSDAQKNEFNNVPGALDYFNTLCSRSELMLKIRTKHPVISKLTPEQKKDLFYSRWRLSEFEIQQIFELRIQPID